MGGAVPKLQVAVDRLGENRGSDGNNFGTMDGICGPKILSRHGVRLEKRLGIGALDFGTGLGVRETQNWPAKRAHNERERSSVHLPKRLFFIELPKNMYISTFNSSPSLTKALTHFNQLF
jgi:hypothetical protein